MNEAQTRFNKIDPKLRDAGWGIITRGQSPCEVMFGEHYIRTEIFSKQDGSLLSDLVLMRDNADYNCFFEADEEKLQPYIEPTRLLIEKIKQYIANK